MVVFFAAMAALVPDGSPPSASYVCTRAVQGRTDAAASHQRGWEESMAVWGALVALHNLYMAVLSADGWPSGGRMLGVMTLANLSIFYFIKSRGWTFVYCSARGDGVYPHVEHPLRYLYWATTVTACSAQLEALSGVTSWWYSAVFTYAMMLSGMGSSLLKGNSPTASYGLLALSFAAYAASSVIKLRASLTYSSRMFLSDPRKMQTRAMLYGMPLATSAQWVVMPIIWTLYYLDVLSYEAFNIGLNASEAAAKVVVGSVISSAMLCGKVDEIQEQISVGEIARVEAEARDRAKRQILRYLFHELRVPLNAIVLGIGDAQDQLSDLAQPAAVRSLSSSQHHSQYLSHSETSDERFFAAQTPSPARAESSGSGEAPQRRSLHSFIPSGSDSNQPGRSIRAILTACVDGAIAMGKILDDFLSLEKIEAGAYVLETVPTRVLKLVEDTGGLFKSALALKKLRLRVRARTHLPGSVMTDPYKLRQCVSNFLSNAIKFSRSGATIAIVVRVVYAPSLTEAAPGTGVPVALSSVSVPVPEEEPAPRPVRTCMTWLDHVLGFEGGEYEFARSPRVAPSPLSENFGQNALAGESLRDGPGPGLSPFIYISVIDEGVGISKEDQGKLFQPFQQIQAGAQQKGNGTGLGLNIVRRIVELMGGRVGVVSEVGVGSEFYLRVPLLELSTRDVRAEFNPPRSGMTSRSDPVSQRLVEDLSPTAAPLGSSSASLSSVDSVVVVDDVESNRMFLGRLLERRGVKTVHTCEDGVDAVEFAKALAAAGRLAEVQLWLLDEEMPRMNGSEAITQLRALGVSATIISITGNALVEDRARIVAAGANGVISKPLILAVLLAELSACGLSLGPPPELAPPGSPRS